MTSRTRNVRGGFGGFEKKSVELRYCLGRRRLTFGARRGLAASAHVVVVGADGKVVIERLCLSLPYVENPFNWKVIKSFFVFRDSYMSVMDIMNVLCTGMNMSISHIPVWLCNICEIWTRNKDSILPITLELEPYHQIQFCILNYIIIGTKGLSSASSDSTWVDMQNNHLTQHQTKSFFLFLAK